MHDAGGDTALDAAIGRLDRAVAQLETRVADTLREARQSAGGVFEQDRARLAAELDEARGRERALEEAGAEAARALGRAITEIRAALGEDSAKAILDEEA